VGKFPWERKKVGRNYSYSGKERGLTGRKGPLFLGVKIGGFLKGLLKLGRISNFGLNPLVD